MATLFVRHTAADYGTWRRIYDDFQPKARTLGVQEFATIEAAQAFAGSADLREAMHEAGVVGAPTIWFATRA